MGQPPGAPFVTELEGRSEPVALSCMLRRRSPRSTRPMAGGTTALLDELLELGSIDAVHAFVHRRGQAAVSHPPVGGPVVHGEFFGRACEVQIVADRGVCGHTGSVHKYALNTLKP